MGMVDYIRFASRRKLLAGEHVHWIENSPRRDYIRQVVLSAPEWVDMGAMRLLQYRARCLTEMTGVPHQLDHIVPLNNSRVCGLTVPWNIEIRTAAGNGAKSNWFAPEQRSLFDENTTP